MGITRDFFTAPIVVPVTFLNSQLLDGELSQVQEKLYFKLRRETSGDSMGLTMATVLGIGTDPELNLARFSNLLVEVIGFDDFPDDSTPIADRARAYFAGEAFEPIIRAVMVFYGRALYPAELFG